ncbi:cell division ATP-binding protein FtsE [Acetobacter peroxydans]|jgi:cell division transport system ATP-binding protein|uniref:cell division ATP-binding protein FtsE n=1 Tax=Acetobacter peroxydans TaxID=104098 RepID=UPI00235454EC|nr:ATP-binding cassette domain-containing protein [Acetobacter peroxydans]MCH4143714.1 ATP-binding cassette domain-containing protein [Acetobacter peroxydans]MCI1410198.1 ATP-binding cassette domain-containing protein [Acetobacter peroxydans]MCI1439615.1 ATP-binding cassette domain-containing protein [Acetobacter peroxydans]MCI1565901.1 ATP-binding cassette domain-containing protein [Acetobacter peroxydans]MCI1617885.1 ATP-binding cassette domain-containing protein [Acetobacter peroxydans]
MIHLDSVSWRRARKDPAPILSRLSFSVPQGGFRWLLGPSGAGKSSLLSLLHVETLPSAGRMVVLGQPVDDEQKRGTFVMLRRRIGMIHQDFRLMPGLSVADNIALPMRLQNRPEDEIRDEIRAILKWVGLGTYHDVPVEHLSGGEQQRTAIARAIIHRPGLILADEPTNALEESQAHRLLDMFAELSAMGATVIVATHNEALVRRLPRPALFLDRGHLVSEDSPLS